MDRRDFIMQATVLGGLSALAPLGAAAAAPTAAAAAAGGTAARQAMQNLLTTINEAQAHFLSPEYGIASAADIAEGQRLLMHILQTGLEFWLEGDPERPVFKPYVTPTRKLLGDNPDSLYYFAPIRGDRSYRIRGNLSGVTFTSFTVEGGSSQGQGASKSLGALDDTQMEVAPDGSFEILVSAKKPKSGNWLKVDATAGQITTRHYVESRNCIAAEANASIPLSIEPLDPPPLTAYYTDDAIAQRIGYVRNFVQSMMAMSLGGNRGDQPRPPWFSTTPNVFNAPGQWLSETGYGNLHAHYAAAPFVLMPDEALVIEGRMPQCRFANVVLWNRFMQAFDYANRQVSLNRSQIQFETDGSFRLVLAHKNPGVPNWLDTEGRVSGLMYWRWLLAKGEVPTPQAKVVKFNSIKA